MEDFSGEGRGGGGELMGFRCNDEGVACAINRRGIPRLRKTTASQERSRKEMASSCYARNDRSGQLVEMVAKIN